jgi:type I restriction enzyme R subunit
MKQVTFIKKGFSERADGTSKLSFTIKALLRAVVAAGREPLAIITDRDELDKQIEQVFTDSGEAIKRSTSGRDLLKQLGEAKPRLLCSLVHKFGKKDVDDFDAFIKELEGKPSHTVGDVFVFVDECHRTQGGKLNRVMKAMMPNAVFIGFTGTPLLKKDRQTSLEVFGGYIHTYKFSEGVEDEVVLDLVYEARDIDQHLGSEDKIDAWFEAKTKGLNEWQRDELKKHWGTLQVVLSSKSRMDHMLERHHNDRFREYMDRFLPHWLLCRDELNRAPLGHESWGY